MDIIIMGITVMAAVMALHWEWACWATVSAITPTGRPLIRPPMATLPLATPRPTRIRPLSPCLRHRFIFSNGGGVKRNRLIIYPVRVSALVQVWPDFLRRGIK
jgi:hypothetical protein